MPLNATTSASAPERRRGNALRAGVFGVNDGLVSNAALIYGVAAAQEHRSSC